MYDFATIKQKYDFYPNFVLNYNQMTSVYMFHSKTCKYHIFL